MSNEKTNKFFSKEVWKTLGVAILIVLAGEVILGWQYHRLEKERLPLIEQQLKEQKQKIEKKSAQDILDKFMQARIEKKEKQASYYLTEKAMEQKNKEEFTLVNSLESYRILKSERLNNNQIRFIVEIYKQGNVSLIEAVVLRKILNQYYIDSVRPVG